jgi:hypothetical protein
MDDDAFDGDASLSATAQQATCERGSSSEEDDTPAARRPDASADEPPAQKKKDDKKEKEKKTKWNCMTRTMFFRCIQKYDPFSSPDKGKVWDRIAQDMHQATHTLVNTADGDFCVYASGKTLNVFYGRCRDKHKASEDGDTHSGGAGKEDVDKTVKEERNQLAAFIELQRSAKEAVEQKREDKKAFDTLRNGEEYRVLSKWARMLAMQALLNSGLRSV